MPPVSLTRRRLLTIGLGATAGLLAACADALDRRSPTPVASPSATPTRTPSAQPSATPEPALAEKVGAMLLVGFRGLAIDGGSHVGADLGRRGLGGVLLFDRDQPTDAPVRNIESPEQVAALTAMAQQAAGDPRPPLLVAIDQEGGRVVRLGPEHGFAERPPSAAELGRGDPATTEATARATGEMLAAAGVNLNLAPVVDLDLNPDNPIIGRLERSYGADPALVVEHAAASIRGHREAGVLTALKHFPGHGSAAGDTHLGVVDVSGTWSEAELSPYRELIGAGLADAVLTAHVFNARLDPDHPATLSRATVGNLLRGELGYDGVVISDDLQMAAIRDAYGFEDAVRLAVEAGVDVLTFANQQVYEADVVERAVDAVIGMVDAGRLDAALIDASWRRIRALRERLALT